MKHDAIITNAILWAAAILSAALLGAPALFTIILLPLLATLSLVLTDPKRANARCAGVARTSASVADE